MEKRFTPRLKPSISAALIWFSACLAVHGAVIVDDIVNYSSNAWTGNFTFTSTAELAGFDPTASDKLVVMASAERNVFPPDPTYNGQSMTLAIGQMVGFYWVGIWYLDNPVGVGDLVFNSYSDGGVGLSLLALSGTQDGYYSTGSSTTLSLDLTAPAGALAVAMANSSGGTISPPASMTPLLDSADANSTSVGSGYADHAGGTVTYTFTGSSRLTYAAAFEAVPEPSVSLLGGLGCLLVLRRRR